jgi:heat shock protein HtpX
MPADVDDRPRAVSPRRRAQVLVAAGALVPAIVLGLIALVLGPLVAVVVFVVVVAAAAAWLWGAGERQVLASLRGRPATASSDARLLNLVEGLCTAAGLRPPRVVVTPHQGLNLLVAGRSADRAVLAVTAGLTEHLSRIELEGVLADGLVQIRRGDIIPTTIAVGMFGLGARWAAGSGDHDAEVDRAGVALTRYPPALASAFETMDRLGMAVPDAPPSVAPLWLADPRPAASERHPLAPRVSALREL